MFTTKVKYLFLAGMISLFVAVVFRNWVMAVISISSFSLIGIGLYGLPLDEFDIEIERERKDIHVYEGDDIWINVKIKNYGERIRYLEVIDDIPENVKMVEGTNHEIFDISHNEVKTIEYKLELPQSGTYELGPLNVRYRDGNNFFTKNWTEESITEVIVLPNMEDISRSKIRPRHTRNRLGNVQSQRIGLGSEFYSLREYAPGDTIRKINWKATARSNTPITNEYEGERSGDVIIIVDASAGAKVGNQDTNTVKSSVRAAATLASDILSDRNRVGLIVIGDVLDWIFPGQGREQFYKIMDSLSNIKSGGIWGLKDIRWIMERFFPKKSLVLFISPLTDPEVTDTLTEMSKKQYDLIVISPSPIDMEKKLSDIEDPLAEKINLLERKGRLDALRNHGIVLDWDPDQPLELCLEEVRRFRMRR